MHRISIESSRLSRLVCVIAMLAALAGCATRKEALLPHGPSTMLDLWNQNAGAGPESALTRQSLLEARATLRRPLTAAEASAARTQDAAYTRTVQSEIDAQFERLPDPDLILYVFPHVAGSDPIPVPGYSTVFSFYERVHYAMPGERTQPY